MRSAQERNRSLSGYIINIFCQDECVHADGVKSSNREAGQPAHRQQKIKKEHGRSIKRRQGKESQPFGAMQIFPESKCTEKIRRNTKCHDQRVPELSGHNLRDDKTHREKHCDCHKLLALGKRNLSFPPMKVLLKSIHRNYSYESAFVNTRCTSSESSSVSTSRSSVTLSTPSMGIIIFG